MSTIISAGQILAFTTFEKGFRTVMESGTLTFRDTFASVKSFRHSLIQRGRPRAARLSAPRESPCWVTLLVPSCLASCTRVRWQQHAFVVGAFY